MTMTGDWTVVKGEGGEDETDNHNNAPMAMAPSMETVESTTTAPVSVAPPPPRSNPTAAAVRFPCMEQPPRFALRSASSGYYLGGTKKGRLVGRKKRSEKDEWTIALVDGSDPQSQQDASGNTNANANPNTSTVVTIHNHKFGNILSMVLSDRTDMGRTAACVSPPDQNSEQQGGVAAASSQETEEEDIPNDLGLGEEETTGATQEPLPNDEEDEEDDDDGDDKMVLSATADQEDMQWCVIRCSTHDYPNGGVMIVSVKTGDCLSVSEKGHIILSPYEPFHVWELECVTGELCFLSNPALDARLRCDMAGLLTLSPNWKGWEVLRITEASAAAHSGVGDGYVRISSWMHSQWFLCSDATGAVSTCSVTESMLTPESDDGEATTQETAHGSGGDLYRCSKWAIERYPTDEDSKHEGLVIRSVTHGRLLSIRDGVLRTYDSRDGIQAAENAAAATEEASGNEAIPESTSSTAVAPSSQADAIGELMKHHTDEMKRKAEEMKRKSTEWWKQSLTNVQKTLSDSAIQRRNTKLVAAGELPVSLTTQSLPEEETIVWQLEAAHLQTYYFISSSTLAQGQAETNEPEAAAAAAASPQNRSIGAFPSVTDNLRKSDKIQLVRNDASPDSLKLYLPDEMFYITCSSKGSVFATKQEDDEGAEWILEDGGPAGGSVFRSKAHGLYLSFRNEDSKTPPKTAFQATAADNEADEIPSTSPKGPPKLKNPFENLKLPHQRPKPPDLELCVTETPTVVWNLEPCTPRAISSKRLKTFAIGTSIAVGTTIAMPFAIAGVAAAMGALGAEVGVGFGIVAAAATGAEALASVGAIGATAYFCFRPEEKSLGDGMDESSGATTNPWSKRPFGNWRNW